MANQLICDNCNHSNTVTSERTVFCKGCHKKLANNYLDWKKTKFNSSFDNYIESLYNYNENVPKKTILKDSIQKKKGVFRSSISSPSKKSMIFITSVIVQLFLLAVLIHPDDSNISTIGRVATKSNPITVPVSNYLTEVKWGTYPITQTLSLSLPFELKQSESVLPCYMENYLSDHQSQKSESSQSFSVSIEKMNFDEFYKIKQEDMISVRDDYMESPGVEILKEESLHTVISGYKTHVEHGSYFKDGSEYLYENYTLTKGNEGVKIILSYLKHDQLLCQYADIVTQSLLKNKDVI
jgi:hypothetical protein